MARNIYTRFGRCNGIMCCMLDGCENNAVFYVARRTEWCSTELLNAKWSTEGKRLRQLMCWLCGWRWRNAEEFREGYTYNRWLLCGVVVSMKTISNRALAIADDDGDGEVLQRFGFRGVSLVNLR